MAVSASRSFALPADERAGGYDALYEASGVLWPARPGRMVVHATEQLEPGRALDLGCGDGKNIVFLERGGWAVDGLDVSESALAGARRRLLAEGHELRGSLWRGNAATWRPSTTYDLILVYGLLHCLTDAEAVAACRTAKDALRPGGLLALASFDDRSPVPAGHRTGPLVLRSQAAIRRLVEGLVPVMWESGVIVESHPPLVPSHRHSMLWGLLRR